MKAADAFYDIVSGVSDATTHMAILSNAMKTATAGQADLKATTSAMVGIMNAYSFSADKATFVSDVLTRSVQSGVLTMGELASAMPQVTGLAASNEHRPREPRHVDGVPDEERVQRQPVGHVPEGHDDVVAGADG